MSTMARLQQAREEVLAMTQLLRIDQRTDDDDANREYDRTYAQEHKMLALHPDGRMFFVAEHDYYHASSWFHDDATFKGHMIRCANETVNPWSLFVGHTRTVSYYSPCVMARDGVLLFAPGLAELFLARSPLVTDVVDQVQHITEDAETQCSQAWRRWPSAKRTRLRFILWCMRQLLPLELSRLVLWFAADQKIASDFKP